MKRDVVFHSFLERQLEEAQALAAASDLFRIHPLPGRPASRFIAEFRCRGLVRDGTEPARIHDHWVVGIHFPDQYLRRAYQVPEILTYLGPSATPWHPNVRPPFVCLRLQVGMTLKEIIHGLYDLFSWNLYATHDPLNEAAAQWARRQPDGAFPVDVRPLKWREQPGAAVPAVPGTEGGGV